MLDGLFKYQITKKFYHNLDFAVQMFIDYSKVNKCNGTVCCFIVMSYPSADKHQSRYVNVFLQMP